jgi:hypothetical protein
MLENPTQGLSLLDAAHTVVVAGVEQHQPALVAWAPLADGLPRQVAVELCFAPITYGPDTGRCGMEVLLDGWRVGELPLAMAERYAPYVDDLVNRGCRPAAVGLVARGPRGLEMEVLLPDVHVTVEATTALSQVAPAWPQPGPETRNRRPYLIGAGVLALLLVVGMAVGGRSGDDEPTVASAPTTAPRTSAPEITLPVPTVAPEPTVALREASDPAPTRAPRARTQAPRPAAPPAVTTPPTTTTEAPETTTTTPTETTTPGRPGLFQPGPDETCVETDVTCPET